MTFGANETSIQDGTPASLFLIQYGDGVTYTYTDSDVPITFDGRTYVPTAIGREKIEASGGVDRKTLEIEITPNAPLVRFFLERPPQNGVSIIIYQGHALDGDVDFLAVFSGMLLSVRVGVRYATLVCEPVQTKLQRVGLRRHYQYQCPHALYGPKCKVNKVNFARTATISALGGNYLDLVAGWEGALAKQQFAQGFATWVDSETGATQRRSILRIGAANDRLFVTGAIIGIEEGDQITVYPGCAHNQDDCRGVFNNINNYGGCPRIPSQSPMGSVNFYF